MLKIHQLQEFLSKLSSLEILLEISIMLVYFPDLLNSLLLEMIMQKKSCGLGVSIGYNRNEVTTSVDKKRVKDIYLDFYKAFDAAPKTSFSLN